MALHLFFGFLELTCGYTAGAVMGVLCLRLAIMISLTTFSWMTLDKKFHRVMDALTLGFYTVSKPAGCLAVCLLAGRAASKLRLCFSAVVGGDGKLVARAKWACFAAVVGIGHSDGASSPSKIRLLIPAEARCTVFMNSSYFSHS